MSNPAAQAPRDRAAALSLLIETLRLGRMAVLCGAGISRHSGLPIVPDFKRELLSRLGAAAADADAILSSRIPFEEIVEILVRNTRARPLLEIFALGQPSTTHLFIAKLVRAGLLKLIVTTNFDCLIEDALALEGLISDRDYRRIYRDTEFLNLEPRIDRPVLIKIHGSAHDLTSMAIALRSVAEKQASSHRRPVTECLFSTGLHRAVLVMGYSCSDEFDISPQIRSLTAPRKDVLFIEHSPLSRVEPLTERAENNPFSSFGHGTRILGDTDDVIRELWQATLPDGYETRNGMTSWRNSLDEWVRQAASPAEHPFVMGLLCSRIGRNDAAVKYFREARAALQSSDEHDALVACKYSEATALTALNRIDEALLILDEILNSSEPISERNRLQALNGVANANFARSNYVQAAAYLERAVELAESLGDRNLGQVAMGNLATCHRRLGNPERAVSLHLAAIVLAEDAGDKWAEANHCTNMGNLCAEVGDPDKAIYWHSKALDLHRALGDVKGQGSSLGALATTELRRNNVERGIELLEAALEYAESLGDERLQAKTLANLGSARMRQGDRPSAETYFNRARELAVRGGDRDTQALVESNLGDLWSSMGLYDKARVAFESAESHARTTGDAAALAACLDHLGGLAVDEGRWQDAIRLLTESLEISSRIHHSEYQETSLHKLGIAYRHVGDYDRCLEALEAALEISKQSGDKRAQSRVTCSMGNVYVAKREYASAALQHDRALALATDAGDVELQAMALGNRGIDHAGMGLHHDAIECYRRAIAMFESKRNRFDQAGWFECMGNSWFKLGDNEEAMRCYAVAIAIIEPVLGRHHPDVEHVYANVAVVADSV